jgi:hypothetical protein
MSSVKKPNYWIMQDEVCLTDGTAVMYHNVSCYKMEGNMKININNIEEKGRTMDDG